jgi:hypothetical protein
MRAPHVKDSVNDGASRATEAPSIKHEPAADTPSPAMVKAKEFIHNLTVWDFIDPDNPWVMVEHGSLAGRFDFIPLRFRVGPWSLSAMIYITTLYYLTALSGAYFSSEISQPWWSASESITGTETLFESLEYPAVHSTKWYYHLLTGFWMLYIMRLIYTGPAGLVAWGTYTVQSWTLLCVRHFLCAAAPVSPMSAILAEWIRFPVACSATITFVLWNTVVGPFIYVYGMKTPEQKSRFLTFVTSFRLTQIHVWNIFFCWANVYWASPPRLLEGMDLYMAALSVMTYMAFYLGILDRIGVHLYPVFSPRAPGLLVVATWTIVLAAYLTSFVVWRDLLQPTIEDIPAMVMQSTIEDIPAMGMLQKAGGWRGERFVMPTSSVLLGQLGA